MTRGLLFLLLLFICQFGLSQNCRFIKHQSSRDTNEHYWSSGKIPLGHTLTAGAMMNYYKKQNAISALITIEGYLNFGIKLLPDDTITFVLEDSTKIKVTPLVSSGSNFLVAVVRKTGYTRNFVDFSESQIQLLSQIPVDQVHIQYTNPHEHKFKFQFTLNRKAKNKILRYSQCILNK